MGWGGGLYPTPLSSQEQRSLSPSAPDGHPPRIEAEFDGPLESKELSEDFTGLRHHVLEDWSVQVSCVAVIRILGAHGRYADGAGHALALRMAPESAHASDLVDASLLPPAQVLAGTTGFVAALSRPDVL